MSVDSETTRWCLPGPAEAPKDVLKAQLEVYGETILLRGFEDDSTWVRTVSADEIANVFTRHLGFSSGLLPEEALWWNQGETGQVVALWRPPQVWPVWPCNGRRSSLPPGSGCPCRGWFSSARRAGRPGPTPRLAGQPAPSSSSSASPPSTSSATGGSAPGATGSPRRWG